ncbi:alpha-L-fucosidase [Spirochaetia bacterium]|nr:alpha-L-fucosidase [Spirochaetia bacterium]
MINRLRFRDERDWFNRRRFGMFIHWGLFSIPAWHEQVLWRGKMRRSDYEKLIHEFNPEKFDPDQWLDLAQSVGMEYVTVTAKHHDGFCMFDTKYTNYNVMRTPYKKDIIRMIVESAKRHDFKLGFYYSIPDWHHPNCPNQGRHHEMWGNRQSDEPDYDTYFQYMENQISELCTNYGEVSQLFWDVNILDYNNREFNDRMRKLQPSLVINNRGPDNGDYATPEREEDTPDRKFSQSMEFPGHTEACQSLGRESWGHRIDEDYYNPKYLMQCIDRTLAMGGNYLLNVGPKADGTIDERDIASLKRIGKWYNNIKEAFAPDTYPATSMITDHAGLPMRDKILLTRRQNTVYVHAYEDLASSSISLRPFTMQPLKATLLNTGEPVEALVAKTPYYHEEDQAYLRLRNLPTAAITDEPLVVKLEFDGAVWE